MILQQLHEGPCKFWTERQTFLCIEYMSMQE